MVKVELDPNAQQYQLAAAIEPVADRLLRRYRAGQEQLRAARDRKDKTAEQAAQDQLDELILFKRNLGNFLRVYAFLSQIFDYGNADIEKRAIFYKRLIPLLEFGREREGVDLSGVELTHHRLRDQGKRNLPPGVGETDKLKPMTEAGSGEVQQKEKALLNEIIAKLNTLFEGELTDDDKLVYVNNVLKGKLLESQVLAQQAANNTKEQFANSPDLAHELMNAIIEAFDAHSTMSKQALDSEKVRNGLRDILLGPARLYEALKGQNDTRESASK